MLWLCTNKALRIISCIPIHWICAQFIRIIQVYHRQNCKVEQGLFLLPPRHLDMEDFYQTVPQLRKKTSLTKARLISAPHRGALCETSFWGLIFLEIWENWGKEFDRRHPHPQKCGDQECPPWAIATWLQSQLWFAEWIWGRWSVKSQAVLCKLYSPFIGSWFNLQVKSTQAILWPTQMWAVLFPWFHSGSLC